MSIIDLSSCSPIYQILETSSPDTKLEKESFVYENTDVKINFNFWSDGGTISFLIYNKLDKSIYIDWDKSHFIFNGISYEYWFDSEETKSFYSSTMYSNSVTFGSDATNIIIDRSSAKTNTSSKQSTSSHRNTTSFGSSSKFKPKKVIQIPSKSGIFVSKFSITTNPYYNCDFNLKSIISSTEFKTKNFTKEDSPINFRNYITYSLLENFDSNKVIDNEFYVSSIRNMTVDAFQGKKENTQDCNFNGLKLNKIEYSYPYKKSNSFYIKTVQ